MAVDRVERGARRRSSVGVVKKEAVIKASGGKTKPVWCTACESSVKRGETRVACVGSCGRSYHIECSKDAMQSSSSICRDCASNEKRCFECGEGIADGSTKTCGQRSCKMVYHQSCWEVNTIENHRKKNFCPRHHCRKCLKFDIAAAELKHIPLGKHDPCPLYSCIRCSRSSHPSCISKRATFLNLPNAKLYLCERHEKLPTTQIRPREIDTSVPGQLPGYGDWPPLPILDVPVCFYLPPRENIDLYISTGVIANAPSRKHKPKVKLEKRIAAAKGHVVVKAKRPAKHSTVTEEMDVKPPVHKRKLAATAITGADVDDDDDGLEFTLEKPKNFVVKPYMTRLVNQYVCPRPARALKGEFDQACLCVPGVDDCSDDTCINRAMMLECNPDTCPCKDACNNRRLQLRQYPPLSLIYTKNRGCGVIATKPVRKGDLIVEYVGEVLDPEMIAERILRNEENEEVNYYMFQMTKDLTIDAHLKGNMARFINHSCDPNCEAQMWTTGDELRAGIFAAKDIDAGVEFAYDYQFSIMSGKKTKQVACRCGSENCSKLLGARPLKRVIVKKEKEEKEKSKRATKNPLVVYDASKWSRSEMETALTYQLSSPDPNALLVKKAGVYLVRTMRRARDIIEGRVLESDNAGRTADMMTIENVSA